MIDPIPRGVASLAANENPLGASARAQAAVLAASSALHVYPHPEAAELRDAIARKHDLRPARVECTHGAEQAIELLIGVHATVGDEVVAPALSFKMFEVATRWAGATFVEAPLAGWAPSVDALLETVTARTRIVLLASPNNPTGRRVCAEEIVRLREALPSDTLLIVDQAYAELDPRTNSEEVLSLARVRDDVVIIRTFSKSHGLAGARVGWTTGPEAVLERVRRRRCPFHLSTLSVVAATAALDDDAHVRATVAHCDKWRVELAAVVERAGFELVGAVANFVCFAASDAGRARRLYDHVLSGGVAIASLSIYGFDTGLRASIGSDVHMRTLIALIDRFGRGAGR